VTPAVPSNVMWPTLTGPHARFSVGGERARRYAPGFSSILAFADLAQPDFGALAPHCAPGEPFYVDGWGGEAPPGWRIEHDLRLVRMVWDAPPPAADEGDGTLHTLGAAHVERALALAALTKPGPFGPRTIELGLYLGVFDGDRLVAMAGERMWAPPAHEISGICTDPAYQGRGLARRLTLALVRAQLARGEVPFLHVVDNNAGARRLYRALGFRDLITVPLRVVSRSG
jgi:GNAT superfamily N-acetyltransferase